nr:hypothetical protein [Lysinibacillus timonensis]
MKKNKLFGYVMTGALSLGVLGSATIPAFAATETTSNSTTVTEQAFNVKASLDDETKQKVQAIMEELNTNLTELGVELPTKGTRGGEFLANLDDETKVQAQAILDEEKAGTITKEEAQTQLADIGVDFPAKGDKGARGDFLANLDDETKEQAQAILDQERAGTITREEAQLQLADLGVDFPTKGDKDARGLDFLANLDDETKDQVQAILAEEQAGTITWEEAQTQLAELGVDFPAKGDKGARGDFLANLDDETKEQAQAILDQEQAGTITREEAQTQLAELGVDFPAKGDKGARGDFLTNLDDETKEQAQALIDEAEEELAELGIDHLPFKGFHNQSNE